MDDSAPSLGYVPLVGLHLNRGKVNLVKTISCVLQKVLGALLLKILGIN